MMQSRSTYQRASRFASGGGLNRWVGWTTLLVGLAASALLDPWFFSIEAAGGYSSSLRPAVRHSHGVVIGMGLLQLAMAHLLATPSFDGATRRRVALLTTVGACAYMTGYMLVVHWPDFYWLVLLGSLANFSGFAFLLRVGASGVYAKQIGMVLPIACFGMLLDFTAGCLQVASDSVVFEYLGAADGVRLRMMRLARVAAIALSVLTLLYYGLVGDHGTWLQRVGGVCMARGALLMPLILTIACFTSPQVKYLLPLPATAVTIGVFLGSYFAWRDRGPLEWIGWGMIAASISAGTLMGLYAFDGPFATPAFLGDYNDSARRLTRIAHSYSIVLGMTSIFVARELGASHGAKRVRVAPAVFVGGCLATTTALVASVVWPLGSWAYAVGPALAFLGAIGCLLQAGKHDAECGTAGERETAQRSTT